MSNDQKRIIALERLISEQQELIETQREYIERQTKIIDRQGRELRRRGKANPASTDGPGLMMWMKQPRRPGAKSKVDVELTLRLRDELIAYQKANGHRSLEKATEAWFLETFTPKTRAEKARVLKVAGTVGKRVSNPKRWIQKKKSCPEIVEQIPSIRG